MVASDGLNSKTRMEFEDTKPDIDAPLPSSGSARIRSSTTPSPSLPEYRQGLIRSTPPIRQGHRDFIVECSQETFDAYGFGEKTQEETIAICEEIFKDHLDGHKLMTNASHIRGSA